DEIAILSEIFDVQHVNSLFRSKGCFPYHLEHLKSITLSVVAFLTHKQIRLRFIPCVESKVEMGEVMDYSVTVEDCRDFLCILFDIWYKRYISIIRSCVSRH
ncbi:MAG TPA: hypothetical protein DCZ97_12820, partial [Syntrophus sp. (in: bacteria)]|nr:hypothetical protein [Syntrophus sp. (in: bacteria)]